MERLRQYVDARGGTVGCSFRPLGAPASVSFDFELIPPPGGGDCHVTFAWQHRAGTALPSLLGAINATKFGPLVCLYVSAEYSYRSDTVGSLAHQAIGAQSAARSLAYFMQFLRTIFPAAALRRSSL
jgi:hypothetical protein